MMFFHWPAVERLLSCLFLMFPASVDLAVPFFFFKGSGHHRDLPSSPTRRSPDLSFAQEDPRGGTFAPLSHEVAPPILAPHQSRVPHARRPRPGGAALPFGRAHPGPDRAEDLRSEEHTSELQSRSDLVCRLLLEKK